MRRIKGRYVLLVYTIAVLVLTCVALNVASSDILIILIPPLMISAVYYPRLICHSMNFLLVLGAVYAAYHVSPAFYLSLQTIVFLEVAILGTMEYLQYIERRRIRTQKALKKSELRYEKLIESLTDFVWRMDLSGRMLYASPAVQSLLGYSPEEACQLHYWDLLSEADAQRVEGALEDFQAGRDTINATQMELEHRRKDGSVFIGEVFTSDLLVQSKGALQIQGSSRDITERKEAEAALRQSEERYRALIRELPLGICRIQPGAKGRYIMANPAAASIFGYETVDAFQAASPSAHFTSQENWTHFVERIQILGRISNEEIKMARGGGETLWCAITAQLVQEEEGQEPYLVCMIHDITRRKKTEALVEEQRSKMATADRLSSLGAMASGVAHEINNPLAIISLAVQQLRELYPKETSPSPHMTGIIEKALRNTERIQRIVRGLRNLSRDGKGEPFGFHSLGPIVEDTMELCRERFRSHGIQLTTPVIAPELRLECRATQIAQVLMNLLSNAEDAVEKAEKKWIRLSVEEDATHVILRVMDSGAGLPPDLKEKVLEPFFSTKSVGKGTGLGLSISKSVVEQHQGELFLNEAYPHTCFEVRLPKRRKESLSVSS